VIVATGLSHLLSADSIYTLKLHRRGIDIDRPAHPVRPPADPEVLLPKEAMV
jgi:CIC family chloride channel protein